MHCSSASGMEALDASRAEVLTAAGHNVKSSWCLAKWPSRGQLASTRRIVEEHFEWLVLQDGGKPTWVCKHCAWTNSMRGFVRPMEHIMFWEAMKPKNYLIIHDLQRVDDIPVQFQQFLEKYSKAGNKTVACPFRFSKEKLLEYAAQGELQAVQWCQFMHWLPLGYRAGRVEPEQPAEVFSQAEAERRHVIALVASQVSVSAGANTSWQHFLNFVAPEYDAPGTCLVLTGSDF